MTKTPEILPNVTPKRPRARRVLFVAFPEVGLLDLSGAQTVFWAATKAMEARGLKGYERLNASVEGGLVRSAEGLELNTAPLSTFRPSSVDTLIVPGSPHIERVLDHAVPLVKWLRRASRATRRTASVCSGAFLLAAAGLLDDKRAATHWAMCDMLGQRFPSVQVDRDAIFVQQGAVWTSAGVTAGIDLALALVEADCGHEVAMEAARELVVFLKRPGGQSQYSGMLQAQAEDATATFDELNLWIAGHLDHPRLGVELLAEQARMSPRNFARVYKQKTGRTPAKAVEVFRLEAARRLLEDSTRNVDQVARLCGFGDEERMRVTFQRHLGVAPRDYRRRFAKGG
ncbi:helix-turn-helix domain-containing protein [Variovorax sp. J22G21]|uniref:GlxA family transcriptional regulator n=1 Tax=Variovorax fucosicus TaxID=3053517 RepID=UPI002578621D|nr:MULTISPECIES: helix-turn-helix domain-containing protein [unclassified Variovorax]MDM0039900.1 helix-turn-helix domain-containing protein [Variovorax sp. J22R193]MDM0064551.1 helix-turn-helix domain-containing protein [Variovorax sp. J22G21]